MIAGLDHKFTTSFSNMERKYDDVVHRISSLEEKITDKLHGVELKLGGEIEVIKDSYSRLSLIVDQESRENNDKLLDLDERINTLEDAQNTIEKQANRIVQLEKDLYNGLQHNRKWNVEIDGIPKEVGDEIPNLEEAVVKICGAIGVNVDQKDIEACHRLNTKKEGPKNTIVRFASRKTVGEVMKNKGKLKSIENLNLQLPGLIPGTSKVYINPSFCPYFKKLAYNCRLLKNANHVAGVVYEDDGTLKIKTLNGNYLKIQHETDLKERFPHFEFNFS